MKCEAIEQHTGRFSVMGMCRALEVSRSVFYRWRKSEKRRQEKQKDEQKLISIVEETFEENRRVYGYRMMARALMKKGITLSEYKVRRIMKENGMYPQTQKKYRPAGSSRADGRYMEDRVRQEFSQESPNRVWAGDITYIRTEIGWVYLSVVVDLFNREIIGYSIGRNIDTELVMRALGNAIAFRGTSEGLIFHSDRGSQYASRRYQEMLRENGIQGSMSRPGCPYDNSCVESVFSTIKKEQIYRRKYDNMEEVKADIFEYIELFYNRKRMHSSLGYLTPVEYRLKYDERKCA